MVGPLVHYFGPGDHGYQLPELSGDYGYRVPELSGDYNYQLPELSGDFKRRRISYVKSRYIFI